VLKRSLLYFIAGILCTAAVGLLNIAAIRLAPDPQEYSFAFKVLSLVSVLFSISLFYLSKIDNRKTLRMLCVGFSVMYSICLFSSFLPSEAIDAKVAFMWIKFFIETGMFLLAATVLLANVKATKHEI